MQIVTTREFRANQKKYFELAEREIVFCFSVKTARPIVISVADDDDYLSKAGTSFLSRKDQLDIKNGRTTKIKDINNIWKSIL